MGSAFHIVKKGCIDGNVGIARRPVYKLAERRSVIHVAVTIIESGDGCVPDTNGSH